MDKRVNMSTLLHLDCEKKILYKLVDGKLERALEICKGYVLLNEDTTFEKLYYYSFITGNYQLVEAPLELVEKVNKQIKIQGEYVG